MNTADLKGKSIHDTEVPSAWVLKVWKMQRTFWGYALNNPFGGGGGTSTSFKSAERLVRDTLSRVPTHMGVKPGDTVLVLVGQGSGDSEVISRAYYATWGGAL